MRTLRVVPRVDARADFLDVVRQQPRAFTFEELAAMGSPRAVRTALVRGRIVRLLHDCYVAAEHQSSFQARADAALAWPGITTALGGTSALYLWGAWPEPPDRIDLCIGAHDHVRAPRWVRVRHVSYPLATERRHRMVTVAPPIAAVQAFGDLPTSRRGEALFHPLRTGVVSPEDLRDAVDIVPRVRGRQDFLRLLDSVSAGAESWLEAEGLRRVFNTKEFAHLVPQHVVEVDGARYRADLYDADTRTVIELDGSQFHDAAPRRARDLRRDAALASIGILTIRLGYRDVVERPEWCRRTVRSAIAARAKRP
ncbi:DUF559 domain-containing protein [Demequina sp. SO4-13]|uniref:DUF559 domain-containing protein n=1 Tax=Demequina sp. SO4-13 TaxID=3401027 RepID=UPI003AF4FE08